MTEGCNDGNCFTKEEFKHMKIKMAGCFQNGKLKVYTNHES